ncbi:hypothetical protein JVT61DRAFT_12629 [Boletus reticuloceps]|uniref:Uncharacterized protein n=1 Tax=Boletus reticuloceps TaxID=495285 RepID=A0A8I3A413_9AGAM|nr:hypothetical protein JVT61DRAFT_12629 [Boletus reticuloceps]
MPLCKAYTDVLLIAIHPHPHEHGVLNDSFITRFDRLAELRDLEDAISTHDTQGCRSTHP